jgi:hypothetical protein
MRVEVPGVRVGGSGGACARRMTGAPMRAGGPVPRAGRSSRACVRPEIRGPWAGVQRPVCGRRSRLRAGRRLRSAVRARAGGPGLVPVRGAGGRADGGVRGSRPMDVSNLSRATRSVFWELRMPVGQLWVWSAGQRHDCGNCARQAGTSGTRPQPGSPSVPAPGVSHGAPAHASPEPAHAVVEQLSCGAL